MPTKFCDSSLTSWRKKRGSSDFLAAAEQALGPRLVRLTGEEAHRGEHVEQHPLGEEACDVLRLEPRHPLDVGDEVAEAVSHDVGDLRLVGGGVRLHLQLQTRAV